MEQSAVKWLLSELKKYDSAGLKDQSNYVIEMPAYILTELEEQAKEIDKQQSDNLAIAFSEWCLSELLDDNEPKAETMEKLLEIFKNKQMKNIYLLRTDKPSRLLKDLVDGTYQLKKEVLYGNRFELPLNIYITSDEEIKDNDYITDGYLVWKWKDDSSLLGRKKIILTTDQDLIKDGVQAIDDEFLEWFIKNLSCEEIIVEEEDYSQKCRECGETVKRGYNCKKGCFMKSGNFIPTNENIKYKIIIPKEEAEELSKQETLEEAAETYSKKSSASVFQENHKEDFIAGAKWQMDKQERMYSEEDMIRFANLYSDIDIIEEHLYFYKKVKNK